MRNRPTQVSKRLPFVAFELGNKEGGNLIYANALRRQRNVPKFYGIYGEMRQIQLIKKYMI